MIQSKDAVRNRLKKGIVSGETSKEDDLHEVANGDVPGESALPDIKDDGEKSDRSADEEREENSSLIENGANGMDADDDEPPEDEDSRDDESAQVQELTTIWRLYAVVRLYYRWFSDNLENIIDDLTIRLFNFYFGLQRE
ncbi:uncharacterized protein [Fopius arisanus]|uniref:Uncharacterized protein n=1 Tax=Fopius arisanus TaxID=64838 RepID=A0A0C9R9A4_9HYME|nr:PREDICTED: uncharacterized protein LOC105264781 [Fopius arisanus]XP_011300197.1 PREDICTED: uncharacterized protein LOC105264781 [Fopius arisanus]